MMSPARTLLGFGVDLLPGVLWRPANLYLGGRLHLCFGGDTTTVRTIEWRGTEFVQGRKPRGLS